MSTTLLLALAIGAPAVESRSVDCAPAVAAFLKQADGALGYRVKIDQQRVMGRDEASSRRIAQLVASGEKRATVARLAEFADHRPPGIGQTVLATDAQGCPSFLYRVVATQTVPLSAIASWHLMAESPALRDLATWRSAHLKVWAPALSGLSDREVEALPLVWQRFELLYPKARR